MELILIVLLVFGIIVFIAYPLVTPARQKIAATPDALETLVAQRDATYDAIRDLDFDFQLGKLSQSDYNALRDKYRARAAQLLQQIDAAGGGNGKDADASAEEQIARLRRAKNSAASSTPPEPVNDTVEAEIARLRRGKTDAVEGEIARVRAARKTANQFCSQCGAPRAAADKFCAKCGNKF